MLLSVIIIEEQANLVALTSYAYGEIKILGNDKTEWERNGKLSPLPWNEERSGRENYHGN